MLPAAVGGGGGGGRGRAKHKHSQRCSAPFAVRLADWGKWSIAETEQPSKLHFDGFAGSGT